MFLQAPLNHQRGHAIHFFKKQITTPPSYSANICGWTPPHIAVTSGNLDSLKVDYNTPYILNFNLCDIKFQTNVSFVQKHLSVHLM